MFERKLFPEAIILGMPTEEFWDGKPSRLLSYIEAYRLKTKRDEEANATNVDYQSWLTGLYVHQGVQVALANSFSKRSKAKYVKEPISFTQHQNNTADSKEKQDTRVNNKYLEFKLLADAMNKNLKKR